MARKISILIILIFTFYSALSQTVKIPDIATDRPDQTESARVIPFGTFQIEAGLFHEWKGRGLDSERYLGMPQTLLRLGVGKLVELRAGFSVDGLFSRGTMGEKSVFGISDLEIGAKVQLFKREDSATEVAFVTHLLIPSGTQNVSPREWGSITKLAISHELSDAISLGYNIGYDWFSKSQGEFVYSAALGIALGERWGTYGEFYGTASSRDSFKINANTGVTYLIKRNLQIDLSVGSGINNKMFYVSTGISYNIPIY